MAAKVNKDVYKRQAPLCAYVFKTVADPFVGKLSFIKVLSGKLTATSNAINARTGQPERLGKTLTVCGKKQTDTPEIAAGDIGAVAKLATARTGDTLCDPARVVALPAPVYPISCYRMAVKVDVYKRQVWCRQPLYGKHGNQKLRRSSFEPGQRHHRRQLFCHAGGAKQYE